MKGHKRADRVGNLIQQEIGRFFLTESHDPRLRSISVSEVRVTDDLRNARIFFRLLGDVEPQPIRDQLDKVVPQIRKFIARAVSLKYVPKLHFEYDTTPDSAQRIEDILAEIGVPPEDEQ